MTDQELEDLIAAIQENLSQVYAADPLWKKRGGWPAGHMGSILHPPPSKAALRKVIDQADPPFPPSYCHFLSLHNGWEHFWLDFTIKGVDGQHSKKVAADIKECQDELRDELLDEVGKLTPAKITAWEAEDETRMYVPQYLVIAATFAGEYLVFDRRTTRKNGDMELVYWTLDYGAWEDKRFPDFYGMLQWARDDSAGQIAKIKRSTAGKKKPKK